MDSPGYFIAPNNTNVFAFMPLRLCRVMFDHLVLDGQAAPPPKKQEEGEKKPPKTLFERYMEGLRVEPLRNAFVIILPLEGGAPGKPFCCTTNQDGDLVIADEQSLTSPASSARAPFRPGGSYALFWTLRRAVAERALKSVQTEPSTAIGEYEFQMCQIQDLSQRKGPNPMKIDREIWDNLTATNMDATGIQFGTDLEKACKRHGKTVEFGPKYYMFARCRVLDRFYIAELLYYWALSEREKTAATWAVLQQFQEICRMTERGGRVTEFETMNHVNTYTEGNAFRKYAWECGRNLDVKRGAFNRAINVSANNPGSWLGDAAEITRVSKGEIHHPCADEKGDLADWAKHFNSLYNEHPISCYFDFYRFGRENLGATWNRISHDNESYLSSTYKKIQKELKELIDVRAPMESFMEHLDCHYDDDFDKRKDFHGRYAEFTANIGYPWWEKFEAFLDKHPGKKLPFYFDWVASQGDVGGVFCEFLSNFEEVQKYNTMLEGNIERTERMFGVLTKYNEKFAGKTIEKELKGAFSVEANFEKGTITIFAGDKRKVVAEGVKFVVVDNVEQHFSKGQKRMVSRINGRKLVATEAPFKKIKKWPLWLAAVGDTMAVVVVLTEFRQKLRQDEVNLEICMAVGRDVFSMMDSMASFLTLAYPIAKAAGITSKLVKLAGWVKGPGVVLEAALNIKEGATILFIYDESSAAKAMEKGQEFEATVEYARGFALLGITVGGTVASITTGVLALGAGTVTTVGAAVGVGVAALGFWLAVAGVFVLGAGVAITIYRGPFYNPMDEQTEVLDKAIEEEFGKGFTKFQMGRTADAVVARLAETQELVQAV